MTDDELLNHKKKHDKVFTCDQCDKTYTSHVSLWKHKKSIHRENALKCDRCYVTVANQETLDRHMKTHDIPKVQKSYECEFCKEIFNCTTNRKRHIEAHHENITYLCKLCDKFFYVQWISFRTHEKYHIVMKRNIHVQSAIWPFHWEQHDGFTSKPRMMKGDLHVIHAKKYIRASKDSRVTWKITGNFQLSTTVPCVLKSASRNHNLISMFMLIIQSMSIVRAARMSFCRKTVFELIH